MKEILIVEVTIDERGQHHAKDGPAKPQLGIDHKVLAGIGEDWDFLRSA